MTETTADVFDELRRFHIYDHDTDEWIYSGTDFGDFSIVVEHNHERETKRVESAPVIATSNPSWQLIWEDGADTELHSVEIDEEIADELFEATQGAVSHATHFHQERIRVARIEAPGIVHYQLL